MNPVSYDFAVRRDDLRQSQVLPLPDPAGVELAPGEALLEIDHFAITANNVTYAAMGEAMNYWDFFPAPEGLGRIPVWGYCEVLRSAHDGLTEGTRIYGFMPMSTHFVVQPADVSDTGFVDGARHRAALPAIYNRYGFTSAESGETPKREPYIALFAPLFTTSFLINDWLEEEDFSGAGRLLLSSASSKTALGLAYLLKRDHRDRIDLVALTSAGNKPFVESTELYDEVVAYDDLPDLDPDPASAYLDFAGNADLRSRIHRQLGPQLKSSTVIGAAAWEELAPDPESVPLTGPSPDFFFAPTRVAKRNEDWGAAVVRRRVAASQTEFIDASKSWLTIRHGQGAEAIGSTLTAFLDGRVDPADGWSIRPRKQSPG